jgi:hypothetical protein
MAVEVLKQEYHRNGISGAGFVVSLVRWTEADIAEDAQPFVVVSFGTVTDDATPKRIREDMCEHTAVLSVPMLADGVIEFAENSWRGADYVGPAVVDAWHDRCVNSKHGYDPFGCGHKKVAEKVPLT